MIRVPNLVSVICVTETSCYAVFGSAYCGNCHCLLVTAVLRAHGVWCGMKLVSRMVRAGCMCLGCWSHTINSLLCCASLSFQHIYWTTPLSNCHFVIIFSLYPSLCILTPRLDTWGEPSNAETPHKWIIDNLCC